MRTNDLTGPMRKAEEKLDQPLSEWLAEHYAAGTLDDVAAALGEVGVKVDRSTVKNWMDRLGIERRFPGQKPEAVA